MRRNFALQKSTRNTFTQYIWVCTQNQCYYQCRKKSDSNPNSNPYPLCIQTNDYHSTHNMQYHDCHVDRDLIITNRRIPPLYKKDYY